MRSRLKNSLWLLLLVIFSVWLYFYHLDYTTLNSWDEGWYASIAREILTTNDWRTLHFNGVPFYDHPPMGFWIMAIVYKLFGVSEFSTRLPSVLAGIGAAIIMYKMGEGFFKKKEIGFVAGMILGTCVWYVLRVRSGNLDSLFLFFYVATVYTAFLTSKTFTWFPLCMALFGALIMTKTLAGVSAGIIILWFILPHLFRARRNALYILFGSTLFYIIVVPWYQYHLSTNTSFYQHHFINIGARNTAFNAETFINLKWELPLFYLHMGVRKWYDPWLLSLVIVSISICIHILEAVKSAMKKKMTDSWRLLHLEFGLVGWNMVVLLPFLTTDLTEIWHLIPVYAPLALMVAYGMYKVVEWGVFLVKRIPVSLLKSVGKNAYIVTALYVLPFIVIALLQIKTFYHEVFASSKYVVDEVDILKRSKIHKKTVYIDRDYVPIAVFYSEQQVKEQPRYANDIETIKNFVEQSDAAVLVTKNSAVEQYMKADFSVLVLEKNNSYSIIEEVQP